MPGAADVHGPSLLLSPANKYNNNQIITEACGPAIQVHGKAHNIKSTLIYCHCQSNGWMGLGMVPVHSKAMWCNYPSNERCSHPLHSQMLAGYP
jgi:hypothetical protein